jgi:hypothetical protein
MLTKEEFKHACGEEIRLVRHIATKVDPAQLDWRPSKNQRSTIELLRYLSLCGAGSVKALLEDNWAVIGEYQKSADALGLDGFDKAMAKQEREIGSLIDSVSPADLSSRQCKLPWGVTQPLGEALFGTALRFLIAYRMQLFLYAKQAGASELKTPNAWMGMDQPQPASA